MVLVAGLVLVALAPVGAEEPAPGAMSDDEVTLESIWQNGSFRLANGAKDPFRPLVKRPEPPVLPVVVSPKPADTKPPVVVPPPKPLELTVQGICGNDAHRLAMVLHNNKLLVVTKDSVVDGAFKVMDITPTQVVVYSSRHEKRQTFALK